VRNQTLSFLVSNEFVFQISDLGSQLANLSCANIQGFALGVNGGLQLIDLGLGLLLLMDGKRKIILELVDLLLKAFLRHL
jgi:hypothetical protein